MVLASAIHAVPAEARDLPDVSEVRVKISIPAGPLTQAIRELARQSGAQILLAVPEPQGYVGRAVSGRLSPMEALTRMIGSSALRIRRVGRGSFVVQPGSFVAAAPVKSEVGSQYEITVTARRRTERLSEVPIAIGTIGGDELRSGAITDLRDLGRRIPSLSASGQISTATPLLVVRGQRRPIGDENRLPVVVYLAEVPLPNQQALLPLFDIASVEVLRGPQGTLFGRNTTGGAIIVNPAAPGRGVAPYVELAGGSYGLRTIEAAGEVAFGSATSLRIAGQAARRNGFTRDVLQNIGLDDLRTNAARAILQVQPTPTLTNRLTIDGFTADEHGGASILTGVYPSDQFPGCDNAACALGPALAEQRQIGVRRSRTNFPPRFRRRFFGLADSLQIGTDALLLKAILSYRGTRIAQALDADGSALSISEYQARSAYGQRTGELQVQDAQGDLRWVVGLFQLNSSPAGAVYSQQRDVTVAGAPLLTLSNYQRFRSRAVFAQGSLRLSPRLTAEAGLRYTGERTAGCALRGRDPARSEQACLDAGGSAGRAASGRLTWTFSLTHRFDGLTAYVASRRAFRSGGYNTPAFGQNLAAFQTFRPETLTDVEVGLKGEWQAGGLEGRADLAAYSGSYRDIQRPLFPAAGLDGDADPGNDPISLVINAARARISGLDISAEARLPGGTRFSAAGNYIDARYGRFSVPPIFAGLIATDRANAVFSYTPRFTMSLTGEQKVALPSEAGQIVARAALYRSCTTYFAERRADANGRRPPYAMVDAGLEWRKVFGRSIDIELTATNLLNRAYPSGGGTLNPRFVAATLIYGAPRVVSLSLRRRL